MVKIEHAPPLSGMRILVADDEFLIAALLEDTFSDAGAEIISAATLAQAMEGAKDATLSAAVLDVRLGRETTEAVADILTRRGVPFFFYSGQALPDRMRDKFPGACVLIKPIGQDAFVDAMIRVVKH